MHKKILERFAKTLECEISNETSLPHFSFLAANYEKGNVKDEDLVEIRGYYKGLRVAREMLQRITDSEEENAEMEGGESE